MLPGCAGGARDLRSLRLAEFSEDLGIERNADLYPTEYENKLRRDKAVCPRDCAFAGARAPRTGGLGYEEGDPHEQGFCRLEPERPAQNHNRSLFIARAGETHCFNSDLMG